MSGETLDDARTKLADLASGSEDVRRMLDFIEGGDRPLLR
jgi:UDP-N-acetylglucosamine acyltransferase